jgi:hypothetical protein
MAELQAMQEKASQIKKQVNRLKHATGLIA